jgi:hypothetical protein
VLRASDPAAHDHRQRLRQQLQSAMWSAHLQASRKVTVQRRWVE